MLVSSLLRGKIQSFVWQNHDQERTNQDTRFYLKTTLPYKNVFYIMPEKIQPIRVQERSCILNGNTPKFFLMRCAYAALIVITKKIHVTRGIFHGRPALHD